MSDGAQPSRRTVVAAMMVAAAMPGRALAQSSMEKRVGVYSDLRAEDPVGQARIKAFLEGLTDRGWVTGRTLTVDIRFAPATSDQIRRSAAELVAAKPDVLFASSSPMTSALRQETSAIPIVFASVLDSVAAGFVQSIARPGGMITGFTNFDPAMAGKWVDMVLEIRPEAGILTVVWDPSFVGGKSQLSAIEAAAAARKLTVVAVDVADDAGLAEGFRHAAAQNGAAVVTSSAAAATKRDQLVAYAARQRLPTVFPGRHHVAAGGLLSYGPDLVDLWRRSAEYVDRILRGESPATLPVQLPGKMETVINLRTARAQGLKIPPLLLARADEVVE